MLGENLQKARLSKNLTQEEVAKELYFSRQAISRWESNKTEPNLETLIALAELYDSDLLAFAKRNRTSKTKKTYQSFCWLWFAIFQLCPWGLVDYCYCSNPFSFLCDCPSLIPCPIYHDICCPYS